MEKPQRRDSFSDAIDVTCTEKRQRVISFVYMRIISELDSEFEGSRPIFDAFTCCVSSDYNPFTSPCATCFYTHAVNNRCLLTVAPQLCNMFPRMFSWIKNRQLIIKDVERNVRGVKDLVKSLKESLKPPAWRGSVDALLEQKEQNKTFHWKVFQTQRVA